MMPRRFAVGLTGSILALMLAGCGLFNNQASYRFRMTVEAKTSSGVVQGSSVYEVRAEKNNTRILSEERAGAVTTSGDALILDMPNGPVFVLMKVPTASESLARAVTQALKPDAELGGMDNSLPVVRRLGGLFSGTVRRQLQRKDWPIMVRFRDPADPKSIEQVDPASIGVRRISVETTGEEITTGIEKRLPSYGPASGFDAWYVKLPMDDPRRFTLDDFRKDI